MKRTVTIGQTVKSGVMGQYLKPQPEKLRSKIRNIVVLMLENRSFDNLLGWLYDEKEIPDNQSFEGLHSGLWNPLDNIDADGIPFIEKVPVAKNGQKIERLGKQIPNPVDYTLPDPDPGEGYADTNHQLFLKYKVNALYPPKPVNMGFVQNYNNAMLYGTYSFYDAPTDPRKIMTCYTPEQTRVLSKLAKNFAVCDQYYASVPSQTLPNRSFVHAATSDGNVNNSPNAFCHSKTIFNQIQDKIDEGSKNLSWGIFGNNLMPTDEKKRERDTGGAFDGDHFSLTRLAMTQLHEPRFDNNFHPLDRFYELCETGDLPRYSFLEPVLGGEDQNDQHPPQDIRPGENLIAGIYNALKSSPAFEETLLVITYDEHGGCYDHVSPPGGAKNPDPTNAPGQDGFRFNRFGIRVPCVLINPFIPKGLIARPDGYTPFDHTSVIKTVQNCLGLEPYLTERSKAAADFSCVLLNDMPRVGKSLPTVQPHDFKTKAKTQPKKSEPEETTILNELHRLLATMVCEIFEKPCPDDHNMLCFIQEHYNYIFGKNRKYTLKYRKRKGKWKKIKY